MSWSSPLCIHSCMRQGAQKSPESSSAFRKIAGDSSTTFAHQMQWHTPNLLPNPLCMHNNTFSQSSRRKATKRGSVSQRRATHLALGQIFLFTCRIRCTLHSGAFPWVVQTKNIAHSFDCIWKLSQHFSQSKIDRRMMFICGCGNSQIPRVLKEFRDKIQRYT